MWKAGQIVTINHKKYRIAQNHTNSGMQCIYCEFKHQNGDIYPCDKCLFPPSLSIIPENCYFKEIKPKS